MTAHSSEWSARDTARYDQTLATADREVSALVTALRIGAAEVGERQAMANVATWIIDKHGRDSMAGLLIAALRQLAGIGAA